MTSHERYNLPPELENDQQAAVLYSPFRKKSLNPQSWTRKVKFWEHLLAETALERRIVTFDVNMLSDMFERKGMKPKCFDTVLAEMKISGRIRPVESYKRINGWLSWGFTTLVKQPITWGVGQLFGSSFNESSVYVWPEVVKILSEKVIELHEVSVQNELSNSLVALTDLRSQCQLLIPSNQDFDIVLTQLERDKKIVITETQDKELVIKFCTKRESFVSPVREIDLQIYRIQCALKKLEKDIEVLSSQEKGLIDVARSHLREGRKAMAMHCLRKKKAVIRMADKMSASLSMLTDILQRIEEASTNEMVVKACEAGAAVMMNINKEMTVEGVESVLDTVRETIENQEEINQALSSSLSQDDNEQLLLDLEQLLNEVAIDDKDDNLLNYPEWRIDDLGLPNVPTHSPSQVSHTWKDKPGTSTQPQPY